MSTGLPSDEVAEDYKGALDDLVSNDRYQIANLTMIAKENIEHAEAISRVLTNHINRAPPTRKLPALYVLDSLVKNIGSPYTVYFARTLHTTFMLAYSQVDTTVRRKLEEMLRTWREPVPGSLSTTPVFPIANTQSIVDTLNKYRASTTANRTQQGSLPAVRPNSVQPPYRQTPTPPQTQLPVHPHYGVGTPPPTQSQYLTHTPQSYNFVPVSIPATPQYNVTAPLPQPQQAYHLPAQNRTQSSVDLPKLHAGIDDLTTDAKIECATHPMDAGAQQKLTTLQTLKEILDSGSASEQDLVDIQNTIGQEMAKKHAKRKQNTAQPSVMLSQHASMSFTQQHQTQPAPIQPMFDSATLASLLQATSKQNGTPQPSTVYPPSFHSSVQQYNTPPVAYATPISAPAPPPPLPAIPSGLFDSLRASGLLSANTTPPQGITPQLGLASTLQNPALDIKLSTSSIRIPRPQLVAFLNERANQCSTCGRRFTSDEIGREKKARHLDWHFKTKARMIEAEQRGQNRSWYLDEREWIVMKEFDDEILLDDMTATNGLSPAAVVKKKPQDFVRAPTDPALRNAPCPIDQEPFKSEWSEEVQDFIWKDAIKVGNRYYHASCYREATKDRDKDGGNTPIGAGMARTATPDSVLGKRKAEDNEASAKSRVKLEA